MYTIDCAKSKKNISAIAAAPKHTAHSRTESNFDFLFNHHCSIAPDIDFYILIY